MTHEGGGKRLRVGAGPGGIVRRMVLSATIPLLSIAAVFYNTHLALALYFLLAVVQFLPGRIGLPAPGTEGDR